MLIGDKATSSYCIDDEIETAMKSVRQLLALADEAEDLCRTEIPKSGLVDLACAIEWLRLAVAASASTRALSDSMSKLEAVAFAADDSVPAGRHH